MNAAENEGGAKAVDSLLNFETVKVGHICIACSAQCIHDHNHKHRRNHEPQPGITLSPCRSNVCCIIDCHVPAMQYFGNEQHEADRYDESLAKFQTASLKTASSLAILNFGQNFILSAGLTGVMLLSAQQILNGGLLRWQGERGGCAGEGRGREGEGKRGRGREGVRVSVCVSVRVLCLCVCVPATANP